MTTTETTADMDRFYELMDFITGGPTSEASLAACDLYAAALARAEAAEAESRRLAAVMNDYMIRHAADTEHGYMLFEKGEALSKRVAELEAAHEWRPVTEEWPPQGESVPVRMRNGRIRWGYRAPDRWYLTGGQFAVEAVTHAYELPTPPQEPTP